RYADAPLAVAVNRCGVGVVAERHGNALQSEAGRTVIVTINNKNYQAQIQADGSWSTTVPATDLQALA
ncbi:hypothetical protein, partial [Pectobacterium carotovorum]|uniref:hypothetical protein n=1 Tax=Pectobacterium carotovorum TaxID=554 RepID=UPI002115EEA6